jgi:4'-phosphopantetheinyl transferase
MVRIADSDIHIWQVWTGGPDAAIRELQMLLSPDERERANRFRFEHLRWAFTVRRGALRILLGRYLGVRPEELIYEHVANGKPLVRSPLGIEFNTSRTEGLAVFAFARSLEIGVDVERIRPIPDKHAIAQRFFCAEEAAELASLPESQHDLAFHLCWTRKEAYIKAIGQGLSAPLDAFRVTLRPEEPARFIHILQDPGLTREWALHNLTLTSGYAAALAYRGAERDVTVFRVLTPEELVVGD